MILDHRLSDALIQVDVEDGTLVKAHPPTCGSCLLYEAGRCRHEANLSKKSTTGPGDVSCTAHRWQAPYNRLITIIDSLRRFPRSETAIGELSEFRAADEAGQAYFEMVSRGERPPVELQGDKKSDPVVKRANLGPFNERLGIDWPDASLGMNTNKVLPALVFDSPDDAA